MKKPIKISLQECWLDAFFTFLGDYINGCSWAEFRHRDILFSAYRGWKNTLFGIHNTEPSGQVKEFCRIIDSMCIPYLNGIYIMFMMKMMDLFTLRQFTEMMVDKINDPHFNVSDVIPKT